MIVDTRIEPLATRQLDTMIGRTGVRPALD